MKKINIIAIAQLPPAERHIEMGQIFKALEPLPDWEQAEAIKSLIEEMADKANHDEYINLCFTNFNLQEDRSDSDVKHFLQIRAQAAAGLPPKQQKRDHAIMNEALDRLDKPLQDKIVRNMPL